MTMAITDLEVLETTFQWIQSGHSVALATVIETWGSAPRKAGSQLVIRQVDGVFVGSVSGGCVEGAVVQQTLTLLQTKTRDSYCSPSVYRPRTRGQLDCPVAVKYYLGGTGQQSVLRDLIDAICSRKTVGLKLTMTDKEMLLVDEWDEPTVKSLIQSSGQAVRVYTPSPRLFIVGAVHIAQALVSMAQLVGIRGGGHRSPFDLFGIGKMVLCEASFRLSRRVSICAKSWST